MTEGEIKLVAALRERYEFPPYMTDADVLRCTRGSYGRSVCEFKLAVRALWKSIEPIIPRDRYDWAWFGLVVFTVWAWWVTMGVGE